MQGWKSGGRLGFTSFNGWPACLVKRCCGCEPSVFPRGECSLVCVYVCIGGWRRQICRKESALLFPQDRESKSGLTADLIWWRCQQRGPSLLLLPRSPLCLLWLPLTTAEPHKGFIAPPWLCPWHTHTQARTHSKLLFHVDNTGIQSKWC